MKNIHKYLAKKHKKISLLINITMTISNRITIKRIFYIFYDALNPKPTQYVLGRWGLHTNDKINLKADFANEVSFYSNDFQRSNISCVRI